MGSRGRERPFPCFQFTLRCGFSLSHTFETIHFFWLHCVNLIGRTVGRLSYGTCWGGAYAVQINTCQYILLLLPSHILHGRKVLRILEVVLFSFQKWIVSRSSISPQKRNRFIPDKRNIFGKRFIRKGGSDVNLVYTHDFENNNLLLIKLSLTRVAQTRIS